MADAQGTELFRVQPDRPPVPMPDIGVHSWPVGSFAPMAFYRPVPIVHFTGTVFAQFLLDILLHAWLLEAPGIVAIGAYAAAALFFAHRAFVRWLGPASVLWKAVTFTALASNLLFFAIVTLAHGCGPEDGCGPSIADLVVGYEGLL